MLKKIKKILIFLLGLTSVILIYFLFFWYMNVKENLERERIQEEVRKDIPEVIPDENKKMTFEVLEDGVAVFNEVVYENMTLDELANKLNKSLSSTLKGKGKVFAEVSLKNGVDPYLAVAISLHETGCKWTCSRLVRDCNNVGGMKGTPGCHGGAFRTFKTLDEGITIFIENLSKNYYVKGLNTVELMAYKYSGGSTTWAGKVNNYIAAIKKK